MTAEWQRGHRKTATKAPQNGNEGTTSVSAKHFKGLRFLQAKAGKNFRAGIVLYLGDQCLRFGLGLWTLPVETLWRQPVGR